MQFKKACKPLALFLGLALAGGAHATSEQVQNCTDLWNDSDAAGYCTASVSQSTIGSYEYCTLATPSCSVTFDVDGDDTSTTITKSLSTWRIRVDNADDVILCVVPIPMLSTYGLRLRGGSCSSGEVDADTAVAEGMPAFETPESGTDPWSGGLGATRGTP